MSYETIQSAVDYYINYLEKVSSTMAVPPKLEVADYLPSGFATGECWLRVIERRNLKTNNVFALRYCISNSAKGTLGPITEKEFATLSEELDMALVEYRRKNFRKISRQQRHIDDEGTKHKNFRSTRS